MSEDVTRDVSPSGRSLISGHAFSRRQVLRTLAASSAVVAGGAVLTACSNGGNKANPNVTLKLGDWPIWPIPGQKADDSRKKATIQVLQQYQHDHPNVKFAPNNVKVDSVEKLTTAIAAGTVPAIYSLDTFGDLGGVRGAIGKNFVPDLTEIYQNEAVDGLMADYAKPIFTSKYNFANHYYCLPGDVVSTGWAIFLRRDLMKKWGIEDIPPEDYTWTYLLQVFKAFKDGNGGKPATALDPWMTGFRFNSEGLDPDYKGGGILGSIPKPGTDRHYHQEIDVLNWKEDWDGSVNQWRKMIDKDKSAVQGSTYNWFTTMTQFGNEQWQAAFVVGIFIAFFPGFDTKISKEIKNDPSKYDEYISFIPLPKGNNGAWAKDTEPDLGGVTFNPRLSKDELAAAANLYLYCFFRQGYIDIRHQAYVLNGADKTPKDAYDYISPSNKYQNNPKMKETVNDVFGANVVKRYMSVIEKGPRPQLGAYLPKPDGAAPPTDETHADLLTNIVSPDMTVEEALKTYQEKPNTQLGSVPSDLTWEEYKQGAKVYYEKMDAYWKKGSPDFWSGDWSKYYNDYVKPALNK